MFDKMFGKSRKKKAAAQEREDARHAMAAQSQMDLLEAATATSQVAKDVTLILRNRLEDSILQIEATAQLISDALIICDSDGTILTFNRGAEKIFGWNTKDVEQCNAEMLFRGNSGDQLSFKFMIDEMANSQNINDSFDLDNPLECFRGKRKNSDVFWIDVHMTKLPRADGNTHIMLIARDVTYRVETQRMLLVNEERYRSIFENSFDGILVVNNNYVVAANPSIANMLGYSINAMIAQPLTMFFDKKYHNIANIETKVRQEGNVAPKNYVVKGIKLNGGAIDLMISSTGMMWGESPASLIFCKDISKLM